LAARMTRRFALALAGAACFPWPANADIPVARRSGAAFGTLVHLTLVGLEPDAAAAAFDQSFHIIRQIEAAASLFRDDSEVARLNAEGFLKNPSPDLLALLRLSARTSARTNGAFDISVQPLWRAFDRAAKAGSWPSDSEIAALRGRIDWRDIKISDQEIRFARPGMAITLNGIAQGYAAERVGDALRARGVANMFLDTGEIESRGTRADGEAWRAGLAAPRPPDDYFGLVSPFQGCLSTSGDYACFWSPDYVRNHIIDPATGASPKELACACVIAPRGGEADALSTALMVMGADKGLALIEQTPGVEALVIFKSGASRRTKNFPLLAAAPKAG